MKERVLIVGGGVSGLAAAGFLRDKFDCALIERDHELGGYCRTIARNGFTWDYSGHFFHFRNQWISDYVHRRIDPVEILRVRKVSSVRLGDSYIDAPLQYHLDQLPKKDLLACLADMQAAQEHSGDNRQATFLDMLHRRYGAWLTEKFLKPYNEKLYGIPLAQLDVDSMGRFFPHVEFGQLLRILAGHEKLASYNENFVYHRRGARGYVEALASYVPTEAVRLGVACEAIDLEHRTARTSHGEIEYDRMIISAPLPQVLAMAGIDVPDGALTANRVLVFNIGFDRPSLRPEHWIYFPDPRWSFYRLGFYDNILGQDRMSLYVEVNLDSTESEDVLFARVLTELREAGIIDSHRVVDYASIVMDPAYVHIKPGTTALVQSLLADLNGCGVFPLGRYGEWKYCSIEDNIVAAHELAMSWGAPSASNQGAEGACL